MRSIWLLVAIGCGGAPVPAPAPPSPPPPARIELDAPACPDVAALQAQVDARCTITGTYELKTFRGKGKTDLGPWPIVTLADGTQVMIESLWHADRRPDDATIAHHRGKVVIVTGTIRTAPPREMPANFGHWTVSPVTSLRLQ